MHGSSHLTTTHISSGVSATSIQTAVHQTAGGCRRKQALGLDVGLSHICVCFHTLLCTCCVTTIYSKKRTSFLSSYPLFPLPTRVSYVYLWLMVFGSTSQVLVHVRASQDIQAQRVWKKYQWQLYKRQNHHQILCQMAYLTTIWLLLCGFDWRSWTEV